MLYVYSVYGTLVGHPHRHISCQISESLRVLPTHAWGVSAACIASPVQGHVHVRDRSEKSVANFNRCEFARCASFAAEQWEETVEDMN